MSPKVRSSQRAATRCCQASPVAQKAGSAILIGVVLALADQNLAVATVAS